MITWIALWSVAVAAPETITLENGVRVVIDAHADGTGVVEVGWFSGVGTTHTAPGATATALMSVHLGTTSVPRDQVVSTWVQTLGVVPTAHLCALDAGTQATLSADGLAAWAWLASDGLADPTSDDVDAAHALARRAFSAPPTAGVDRAPSPWSWPSVVHPPVVDVPTLRLQRERLADPTQLVVVVRGDTSTEQVREAVGRSFERLPQADLTTPNTPTVQRNQRVVSTYTGEPHVVIHADIDASMAARSLAAALNDRVKTALDRDAFDAWVELDETGDVWTLTLHAIPSVGRGASIEGAWLAWLQTVAGEGLEARPQPPQPTTLVALAHTILRPELLDEGTLQSALSDLLAAQRTVAIGSAPPVDADLDRIREQHGELTAELVRIRLRTVAQTPEPDLPQLLIRLRTERDAVAPRLRPALDIVIARAEARL